MVPLLLSLAAAGAFAALTVAVYGVGAMLTSAWALAVCVGLVGMGLLVSWLGYAARRG